MNRGRRWIALVVVALCAAARAGDGAGPPPGPSPKPTPAAVEKARRALVEALAAADRDEAAAPASPSSAPPPAEPKPEPPGTDSEPGPQGASDADPRATSAPAEAAAFPRVPPVERLRLHDVRLRLATSNGVPLGGVAVRALHVGFDLAAPPVETDPAGRATVRLPFGRWRVDLASAKSAAGKCVFARRMLDVEGGDAGTGADIGSDGARDVRIALGDRREVRLRDGTNAATTPDAVTLSVPDFSFHAAAVPAQGSLSVLTDGGTPIVLQAARVPDEQGGRAGYVLRREIGPGTTVVATEAGPASSLVFQGSDAREVRGTLRSADALPFDVSFATHARREMRVSGVPTVAVKLAVRRGKQEVDFYPLPIALGPAAGGAASSGATSADETSAAAPRVFTGEPPFDVSVGIRQNTMTQYKDRRNSVTVRVFLREANGLVVRGAGKGTPYDLEWEETFDGAVRAKGKMDGAYRARTAPIAPADLARLRYRVHVSGPGEDRTVEVVPHTQTAEVVVGKVHVATHPELEASTRLWAACVADAVQAYEDTCTTQRSRVSVGLAADMPPGTGGWGGFSGNRGWMMLPDAVVFGFAETSAWSGVLGHELGHVHGYWHSNAAQKTAMRQAGQRASRRYGAIRPGMGRAPEGNRFLPVLDAVTRGELTCDDPGAADDAGDDADDEHDEHDDEAGGDPKLEPDLDATGEDDFLAWFLRRGHGVGAYRTLRSNRASWAWWLTIRGFTDDEIDAAAWSRAAGEDLAAVCRLRGLAASDARTAEAVASLAAAGKRLPSSKTRAAALARWRGRKLAEEADLGAARAALLGEVGDRAVRVEGLRALGEAALARGDAGAARAAFVAALREARRAGRESYEAALTACASAWAAANE